MDQTSRDFQPAKHDATAGAVKRVVATFSVTSALLYAGLVFGIIGIFLPWGTVAAKLLGQTLLSQDVSVPGWVMFAVVLIAAAAAWLAWPALWGSPMPQPRLIGLTVSAGLLVGVFAIGLHDFLSAKSENTVGGSDLGGVDVSVGSGLLFYAVAVIAIAVGIVRLWMGRSKTPRLT